jgi:TRAP-type C4-dicarboxylate transport system permease large subunit
VAAIRVRSGDPELRISQSFDSAGISTAAAVMAALIILVPLFLPIAQNIGVDAVHFGVIIVVNLMIGLCTLPAGYLICLTADIAKEEPMTVIVESLPFVAALVVVLALTTFVPAITLVLPDLLLN